MIQISIDGISHEVPPGEHLIDAINRAGIPLSQVCYLPILGPIQTCDTCIVEVDGKLVRACSTLTSAGMKVSTTAGLARASRTEAFDRLLRDHDLYCTVCNNNNGNCTVHNTTKLFGIEHQHYPFQPKPYEIDNTNPFYRYDPSQCVLCGRCVEACQDLQVNAPPPEGGGYCNGLKVLFRPKAGKMLPAPSGLQEVDGLNRLL